MNIFEYIPLLENYVCRPTVFQTISEEGNSSLPSTDPRTVRFLEVHEGCNQRPQLATALTRVEVRPARPEKSMISAKLSSEVK